MTAEEVLWKLYERADRLAEQTTKEMRDCPFSDVWYLEGKAAVARIMLSLIHEYCDVGEHSLVVR